MKSGTRPFRHVSCSINHQAARNNSGELCNLGVDLLHSNLFPLLNQHCLHLGDCHNPLGHSAPSDSPLKDYPYAFNWVEIWRRQLFDFADALLFSLTACKMSTV